MRFGLNTGTVVVGRIGDDLRMDYTAQGDTTNLAARMQQMAPPGAVWAAEATYRAAGTGFEWQALGPMVVKGKAVPVTVYELRGRLASRSRFDVLARRGLTRFCRARPRVPAAPGRLGTGTAGARAGGLGDRRGGSWQEPPAVRVQAAAQASGDAARRGDMFYLWSDSLPSLLSQPCVLCSCYCPPPHILRPASASSLCAESTVRTKRMSLPTSGRESAWHACLSVIPCVR
jgi:hypothetical protein